MLSCSHLLMTLAWYGHLKFKSVPLVLVILMSWGIAFFEYCFAVPANRVGSAVYSTAELKTIQEVKRQGSRSSLAAMLVFHGSVVTTL
jgi:uncharacterized protein (DUF486 family)